MGFSGENKRARIEMGQFLFLEMDGELFGIDLSGDGGGSDSQISSLSSVTRCRVDLYYNDYPLGMCYVKMGDKHYLMGGLKRNLVEYSDDVYELETDLCRISSDMINDPKHVLKPAVSGTRIKDPKIAMAFNLKGKHYLLHSWVSGYAPIRIPVPFERLDVAVDVDAAAPPFSCHEVPGPPSPFGNPSVASSHFILDDNLVLFFNRYAQIYIFTPDDDSGNGKWSLLDFQVYDDSTNSFESFTGLFPSTEIILSSEFHVPDPDDATNSLRVLLTFGHILEPDQESGVDAVCAYAISTKTFKAKYYQKLDGVLSDLIPDYAWMKNYFLEDVGKGDQEGTRRMCAITTPSGYVDDDVLISYLTVSVFDVQMIQPAHMQFIQPPSGLRQFLKVFPPIKMLAFKIDHDEKFRNSPVTNTFFI